MGRYPVQSRPASRCRLAEPVQWPRGLIPQSHVARLPDLCFPSPHSSRSISNSRNMAVAPLIAWRPIIRSTVLIDGQRIKQASDVLAGLLDVGVARLSQLAGGELRDDV